jgi:hypothetical protein
MNEEAAAARRYRKRAKEIRGIAEGMVDGKSRMTLLRVARDYDRLARLRIAVGKADRAKDDVRD